MKWQGGEPTRVLLIDDDPEVSSSVKVALQVEGYRVAVASSGMQGVEMAAMSPPDIIVLDVEMPIMGGPDTLKELRRNPNLENTVVIFLTGKVDMEAMEGTLEGDAQGYLLKPFSTIELLNKIEENMGKAG
ncbi:MAG: response regulator [Candidatus Geothermincolia bacterium]